MLTLVGRSKSLGNKAVVIDETGRLLLGTSRNLSETRNEAEGGFSTPH